MMNMPEINEHIGIYSNAVSTQICDTLIQLFDFSDSIGKSFTRKQHENAQNDKKNDTTVIPGVSEYKRIQSYIDLNVIWNTFNQYYSSYEEAFADSELEIAGLRLQKTNIGQGYHQWHHDEMHSEERCVTFILYLNDVKEGGETEFLYQHKRIEPRKGTMIFFPASYTHVHRGNTPISGTKYICTGWISSAPKNNNGK
jgi:hypothetical protein